MLHHLHDGSIRRNPRAERESQSTQTIILCCVRWTRRDVFVCETSFMKNAKKPALFQTYAFSGMNSHSSKNQFFSYIFQYFCE